MFQGPALRAVAVLLAIALSASAVGPQDGTQLTVTKKATKIRNAKRLYATGVADVREGDKLELLLREAPWCQVRFQGKTGWVHETDVSERSDVRLSGQGVRENYSAAETAAGKKGFNSEIEKNYEQQRPDLKPAFDKVDQVQARGVAEAELVGFLRAGGLIEEEGR
ncbi:MAG: hypothetical protein IPN34_20360 [Planctomycetes bacterium]|nr:hypothetical protein [Planctomycetota bacterium]